MDHDPVELVRRAAVKLEVEAEGEIRAAQATPVTVPGKQFMRRQPTWLLPDGSPVQKGDLIARFSPEQSELELAQILVDLQRNQLARNGKEAELGGMQGRVDVDLAEVAARIVIARRYAGVDMTMLARNDILDAIDDEKFLGVRQDVLQWKRDRSSQRGTTEIAVLEAQRSTHERNATARRDDLASLELRAPHAGMLMLAADWTGEKPRVGITLMSGQVIGYLPNIAALEVELKLPQAESQGVSVGQRVRLHLVGRPETAVDTKLSSVAASAQVRSRDNPARYLTVKAPLPAESVATLKLVPGQRMKGWIEVLAIDQGISVPNVAVVSEDGRDIVHVRSGSGFEARTIELGVRGMARSEVKAGLNAGDAVLLTPPRNKAADVLVPKVDESA